MKLRAFLAPLVMFCVLSPALGQTKPTAPAAIPPPQKPADADDDVVKIRTNLVQVDAVVTKDGKLVKDLTADDFEIYEDGRKQAITSFSYISNVLVGNSQPVSTARDKGADVVPLTPLRADAPRRTIALLVDDVALSAESLGRVRRELKKFLAEEIEPNDLVAIIRTGGQVGALQQFTNDRRILNRAIEQLRWNPCNRVGQFLFAPSGPGPSFSGEFDEFQTSCGSSLMRSLKIVRFVLDAMGELPGRKSLVLLSDSIPESWEYKLDQKNPGANGGVSFVDFGPYLQRISEKAIRSSVVIYSVDTQGLPETGITVKDSFDGNFNEITNQMNAVMAARSKLAIQRREGAELIARETGGFQIRNTNSLELERILEDQSGYYLIGYRPTDETFNRRFHKIKAKVKRSGMSLRTRVGFFGMSEEDKNKERSVSDLTKLALMSPFGKQDINVDITSFFRNEKTIGSMIRSYVYVDIEDVTLNLVDGRRLGAIELHGVVFGDNGVVESDLTRVARMNLTEADYERVKRYGMSITFEIPVKHHGVYQMRIAARDTNSSHIGSAGQFVAVPNLNNKRLAVSGIVLGTNSAGLTLANAGTRKYPRNSDIHFGYLLYNAASESGALRNLIMQSKLFRDGKIVYTGQETPISAANQTDLNRLYAGGVVHLPAELEPGNYYLQVVVIDTTDPKKKVVLGQWANFEIET